MDKKVVAVLPLADLRLIVWFEAGVTRQYDAHHLVEQEGPFESLATPSVFKRVRVRSDGMSITWGNGMVVSSEELYANSEPIDIVESEKHRLLNGLAEVRHNANISQMKLGEAAGIRQPVISRIEGGDIAPQINTLFKLLAPMGKTLEIVDLKDIV